MRTLILLCTMILTPLVFGLGVQESGLRDGDVTAIPATYDANSIVIASFQDKNDISMLHNCADEIAFCYRVPANGSSCVDGTDDHLILSSGSASFQGVFNLGTEVRARRLAGTGTGCKVQALVK